MYDDPGLVREILQKVHGATQIIAKRFEPIQAPEDFTASDQGHEKLDSICMQLIAIGEAVKKLDKITEGDLLKKYPEVEWKGVMGIRDVLSHHYFDMDVEIVFSVCNEHVGHLASVLQKIIDDLSGREP